MSSGKCSIMKYVWLIWSSDCNTGLDDGEHLHGVFETEELAIAALDDIFDMVTRPCTRRDLHGLRIDYTDGYSPGYESFEIRKTEMNSIGV